MCVLESVGFCMSSGPAACALRAETKRATIRNRRVREVFIEHQPEVKCRLSRQLRLAAELHRKQELKPLKHGGTEGMEDKLRSNASAFLFTPITSFPRVSRFCLSSRQRLFLKVGAPWRPFPASP